MFEVVKVGVGPGMCCYRCRKVFNPGEETEILQIPIYFRWGKERKKAKGYTHIGLRIHSECKGL